MQMQLRFDAVTRAFADALAAGWGARLGHTLTLEPAGITAGSGWLVVMPAAGAAQGQCTVWFGHDATRACARLALGGDSEPDDPSVEALLRTLVAHAAANLESSPAGAGLSLGEPVVSSGTCPAAAQTFVSVVAPEVSCQFAVLAQLAAAGTTRPTDRRLEAVLDVDLPLVVRFGRTVMPLRAVADLGPGAVIDMGRSPDEPVDLLVGDRVIARGDVVIVGGNYGVRITEVLGGREAAPQMEASTSW